MSAAQDQDTLLRGSLKNVAGQTCDGIQHKNNDRAGARDQRLRTRGLEQRTTDTNRDAYQEHDHDQDQDKHRDYTQDWGRDQIWIGTRTKIRSGSMSKIGNRIGPGKKVKT